MDDLLASIRKIIADDGKDGPDHAPYDAVAAYGGDSAPAQPGEGGLSNRLEQSIMDAFREEFDGAPRGERRPQWPEGGVHEDAPEEALRDIAEAIHAERAAQNGAQADAFADDHDETVVPWTPVVLSEPDLDDDPVEASEAPASPQAEEPPKVPVREAVHPTPPVPPVPPTPRTATEEAAHTAETGADEAAKPRRRKEMFGSATRAVPPHQPAPRVGAAHAASRRAAAKAPAQDTPMSPSDREPHLHLIKPHRRTADMTEIAQEDPTMAVHREGNVFRRQSPQRSEPAEDTLTSTRTRQNVTTSLDELSRTILTNNPRTLEDLVRDMMRPLLREWLDNNLSDIVERQVRQEIDRVSARGR
ncbi:MAG: DUF2497 domain-containing protein [Pseudomonadota bacterium]